MAGCTRCDAWAIRCSDWRRAGSSCSPSSCQEEKLRALNLVVWLVVALTLGVAGLLVGLGALAIWLWNVAGFFGLIGLMLAALAAAAGVLWKIRRRIRTGPAPFAETLAEFRKDRECLRTDK